MRPNFASGTNVPASDPLGTCVDIWTSTDPDPSNSLKAVLATPEYLNQASSSIALNAENYIYVRAFSTSPGTISAAVSLYLVPNNVIQFVAQWQPLSTQSGNATAAMANVPNSFGVSEEAFVWPNAQPPPSPDVGYNLIAWINDGANPFPDSFEPIDISELITNNLGFGWLAVEQPS